jgi:hypothetical protein
MPPWSVSTGETRCISLIRPVKIVKSTLTMKVEEELTDQTVEEIAEGRHLGSP